jgi:quercetin dioxygenase-like cupin family protein
VSRGLVFAATVSGVVVGLAAVASRGAQDRTPASSAVETASAPSAPAPIFDPIHPLAASDETVLGDPEVAGAPFVLRIRELPGTIVPPHTHTFDENITVVHGTWYFGIGDRFDSANLHALPEGSFAFAPAGTPMFAYAPDGVIVQVHGIGPYTQAFCQPLLTLAATDTGDSAGVSPSAFRFRQGELVSAGRGTGRIRQGYASGNVIQDEVVAQDGSVFMAQEKELERR